jgi:Flp pilus assembly protein CpaB
MTYRRRNIVIALGLALLAVVFMVIYVANARKSDNAGKGVVSVLVATRDIQEGTPGSSLQSGAFLKKRVPRSAVVPGYISSPKAVTGSVATQETLAGEQLTTRKFGPIRATGVRTQLNGRERVVQLAGDKNQVLDGTLKVGDRVDIMGAWNVPENCGTCHVSRVIVRNVLVLGTSAELSSLGRSSTLVPVQLRLTDAEAEQVFWMTKNGEWSLVLRPVVRPRSSTQGYDSARSILGTNLSLRGPSG